MCAVETAATGSKLTVVWAETSAGKRPALEFFEGLTQKEQAKCLALFQRLAEIGVISNKEQFKKLEGWDLWEFKHFQIRFIGGFGKNKTFALALGLKKKRNLHQPSDLEKAAKVLLDIGSPT